MRFFFAALFIFISFAMQGQTKSLPASVVSFINERIAYDLNPGIVVGIIDKDGPRYYSFGRTKKKGKKVNEHFIYEIGSISKVFTATLLAKYVVECVMKTDDPIEQYLPATVKVPTFDGEHITLGHLSDHTSSLPREPDNFPMTDPENPFSDYTLDLMYSFLSNHKLLRPIGSEYEYSNLGAALLGNILAAHANNSYEKLMIETIAKPLQMHETKVTLSKKMKKNLAVGHDENTQVKNWDLAAFQGAGGIRSSVHDMLIFLGAHLQLFDHPLEQPMLLTHQARHIESDFSVGLGWHIVNGKNGDVIWHNGSTGGYSTFAGFVKETGMGVVVMTNSRESVDDIGFHLLDPSHALGSVVPHIAIKLKDAIESNGAKELATRYAKLKSEFSGKYDFSEDGINSLGYYFLRRKQFEEAQEVFLLNIQEFPGSSNVYDSYAEALMESGDKQQAIVYYKKSLGLNPGNTNAITMLSKMGVMYEPPVVHVNNDVLKTYLGVYELSPAFRITVTMQENQLYAQATGQSAFPIYPKSRSSFYYKVVDAQIVFNQHKNGTVESLTLFQNGKEVLGRKIN